MLGEGAQLGVQFRIKPVGRLDAGFEIVEDQHLGHAAEVPEGIFQAANEVLGRLPVDGLAVALARVAQDDAKDVRAAPLAVGLKDRNAAAEIDLGFLAGSAFHAAERQRSALPQATGQNGGRCGTCRRSRGR